MTDSLPNLAGLSVKERLFELQELRAALVEQRRLIAECSLVRQRVLEKMHLAIVARQKLAVARAENTRIRLQRLREEPTGENR